MAVVLILGDLHFGKSLSFGKAGIGAGLNSRIVDQLDLMNWTLDQAVELNAKRIVITGDVFEDPKPTPAIITLFLSWLNKCGDYGVEVHLIMGNHDILRSGTFYNSPLDIISESELTHCQVFKDISTSYIDDVAFTYLPFRDRKSFICAINSDALSMLKNTLMYEYDAIPIPYKKVLVGHFAIEGSIPVGDEIDDLANEIFCPVEMFNGYDYVWMGHIHKPQVINPSQPFVAHIGSMDISNFGETGQKKHIVIFDTEHPETFTTIELPTRKLEKITVSVPKDTEDTTAYVLKEIENRNLQLDRSIVRVEISLASPELKSINRMEVEKFLQKSGVFNIAGLSESKKTNLIKKDSATNNMDTTLDVPGAIKMWAQKKWGDDLTQQDKSSKFIEVATQLFNKHKLEGK